jgi:hypothetical protein
MVLKKQWIFAHRFSKCISCENLEKNSQREASQIWQLQWALLNGITDNGINWISESVSGTFSQSHQLENWRIFIGIRVTVSFAYWDQIWFGPK